jgi:hypothetical protein
MTTAVCKAANILGLREELLSELLVLINMTSGVQLRTPRMIQSAEMFAAITEPLIDEYSKKC